MNGVHGYTRSTVCSPRELVIRNVMELIRQRSLSPDSEVPAETLLAERFGVSRGTVRSGLAVLAARGVIEKRGRRFTADEPDDHPAWFCG